MNLIFLYSAVALGMGLLLGWAIASARSAGEVKKLATERDLAFQERSRSDTALAATRKALEEEQKQRTVAETRLSDQQRQLESHFAFVQESRQQLEGTYAKLSQDALTAAVERIAQVVKPHLDGTRGEIVSSLDTKKVEIEGLLTPLREMLDRYQNELRGSEEKRAKDYVDVKKEIDALLKATEETRSEASKLSRALGSSKGGGNWGELALRRCVEIAGLTEHCDFEMQTTFLNEDESSVRPDMIVRLPHDRVIFVDAKAPKEAFDKAMAETDEALRASLLRDHSRNVRRHVEDLARRKYPSIDENSIDFTVLFMPSDHWLSAALAADTTLFELSLGKRVILASPTLLIPVLRVVASAWNVERAEENANKSLQLGRELYERFVKVFDDIEGLGRALNTSVKKYNDAVRSIDQRLVPKANQLFEHVESRKPVPEFSMVEATALESTKMPGSMRLPIRELQQPEEGEEITEDPEPAAEQEAEQPVISES